MEFKYRPEVDGLRAVAVVMVLIFHTDLGFSGGFVGVDVFFVISGFLITGLILKEQQSRQFKISNFWIRRIRRIAPASTFMAASVLVGGLLFLPPDYKDLAKSMVAQQLTVSNFYFLRHGGYFDGPSELKPLLHTWSLAVEEQFYFAYPIVLVGLRRLPEKWSAPILLTVCLASLVLSEWAVRTHPGVAFYLLPARAWELLVGALICFAPSASRWNDKILGLLSWLGMLAIVVPGVTFSSRMPFPGLAALIPCGGAALLIYANSAELTGLGRILALKPLVFIGLISYSLYLWHWPILVWLRYNSDSKLGLWECLCALSLSFILAWFSWRYVETPFRQGQLLKTGRSLVTAMIVSTASLIAASGLVVQTDGLMARYDSQTRRVLTTMKQQEFAHNVSEADVVSGQLPTFGAPGRAPRILVWGDSHAMSIIAALDRSCRQRGIGGAQATYKSTLPLLNFPNQIETAAPITFGDCVIEYIERNHIKIVVMAGYWQRAAKSELFVPCLTRTIDTLRAKGCSIVVVRDVPNQRSSPQQQITKALRTGTDLSQLGPKLHDHRQFQATADAALLALKPKGVIVLDPTMFLVDNEDRCRLVMDGDCLYWDSHHVTESGALRLIPMFDQALDEIGTD